MKFKLISRYMLVLSLTLPFAVYSQDVHRQIQEMERERLLRAGDRFLSQMSKVDQSGFDVTYYQIRLDIDPSTEIISGDVTTRAISTIQGLKEITLDFYDNMDVDSVVFEGVSLPFSHANNELTISLGGRYDIGELFSVTVYYSGHPVEEGGFHSFTFEYHQGVPIISTLSEPFGSPTWWPCKDNPADKADSVDIIITVPKTLIVASNGTLMSETYNGDGTTTFFWAERYPISTYLVSLAISNYSVFSDYYYYSPTDSPGETDSMEVRFFVYPEDSANAKEDFNVTVDMIEYYSSVFGEYPFIEEKYGMAEFPWHGAMEHQTCTSYGKALIQGNHYYDMIVAHELAHQWFGDLITMKWWSHIWLNEGFASYAEALWAENLGGEEAYLNYMDGMDSGLFPTSVFVYDSTNISSLFSYTVYDKGAWVLHMLRHVMGDTAFFQAMTNYREAYTFGNATTEDFRNICEAEYRADLEWFFKQWVYGLYRPSYEYNWYDTTAGSDHLVVLTLNQVQTNTGLFKMPLDIVLSTASAETTIVIWDSLETQVFEFVLDEEVTKLEIDPDGWVLKHLQYAETFSVGGNVYDIVGYTPLENVKVYFIKIDEQGSVESIDSTFTDAKGHFFTTLLDGFYAIYAVMEGYLSPPTEFREVNGPISDLEFILTSPAFSIDTDSIIVFLEEGGTFSDTIRIENSGSGQLLFSVAPVLTGGNLMQSSHKVNLLPILQTIDLSLVGAVGENKVTVSNPPEDSLWKLIYQDPEDNSEGTLDLNETWMQVYDDQLYLKVTFYHAFEELTEFQYILFADTDGDPETGLNVEWFGADYLIIVSDFGVAKGILYEVKNENYSFASYEDVASTSDEFTVGFPLTAFGSVDLMTMFSFGQNLSDFYYDTDSAPDENFGYFLFSTDTIPWLNIEPNFGFVNSSEAYPFLLTVTPEALSAGHYNVKLIFGNNEPDGEPKVVPIIFNYMIGIEQDQYFPETFSLSQNYPNPFNSETVIRYELPYRGLVTVNIYDLLGRKIRILADEVKAAGSYSVKWDGRGEEGEIVSSGIYLYQIQVESERREVFNTVRKMVLMR